MKTKPMRLWAVVIGKKGPRRWIAVQSGFVNSHPLAVFETRGVALVCRKELLRTCGHKDIFVIPFSSESTCPRLVKEHHA